eukprot:COSAG01_NODE_6448_length_3661_cov_5.199607_2_plen_178_part_00
MKRHQETGQPLPSLLYLVVDYLVNRGPKGGRSARQDAANRGVGANTGATTTAANPALLAPAPTSPPPVQAMAEVAGASGSNLTTVNQISVDGHRLDSTVRGVGRATGQYDMAQDFDESTSSTTAQPLSEKAGSSSLGAKPAASSHLDNDLQVEDGGVADTGIAQVSPMMESHGFKFR